MGRSIWPPRRAVRRTLGWPTRVIISVAVPLSIGVLLGSTGLPRWVYNRSWSFWALTGLYDATPIQIPARSTRLSRPPLSPRLRFTTEGFIYAVMITPAFVLALFIYDRLTFRYSRDRRLHCLECGHILQGLSEPRCPECGTLI